MLEDISEYKQNLRAYGGLAGQKVGLTIDGVNWMIKYPGNLKHRELKNIQLSYSNGPVCEYLGSHFYEMLGIETHKTKLAVRNGKLVVMCKDFVTDNARLIEFRELKSTYEPAFMTPDGGLSEGTGSDLEEALVVIRNHPTLELIEGVEQRFWQMFIIDFILGNPDRNNGNWGILITGGNHVALSPVYDNGNCLNDKWDDEKMLKFLEREELMNGEAYGSKVCFFTRNGKKIKPYSLIRSNNFPECTSVLRSLMPKLLSVNVEKFFTGCDFLSNVQKEFYTRTVSIRIAKLSGIAQECAQLASF